MKYIISAATLVGDRVFATIGRSCDTRPLTVDAPVIVTRRSLPEFVWAPGKAPPEYWVNLEATRQAIIEAYEAQRILVESEDRMREQLQQLIG